MTVQRISNASVALYLTPEDLEQHSGSREELDVGWTLEVTEEALRFHGIPLEGTLEIEAFPDEEGVLLLARICPQEPVYLHFSDLESVLEAARARPSAVGKLFWAEGQYVLSLPSGHTACALTEFGRLQEHPTGYEIWLREHGRVILTDQALRRLAETFPA